MAGGSNFAVVGWGGDHIRVYSSDGEQVTEQGYDGSSWSAGDFNQPGQYVAAVNLGDDIGIRVYCTDNGITTEYVYNNGWSTGSLNVAGLVAAAADIGGGRIRVFVDQQDTVIEYCYDGDGWYNGGFPG